MIWNNVSKFQMCPEKKSRPATKGLITEDFREEKVSQCSSSLYNQSVDINTSESDLKGAKSPHGGLDLPVLIVTGA